MRLGPFDKYVLLKYILIWEFVKMENNMEGKWKMICTENVKTDLNICICLQKGGEYRDSTP